jgi:hypothetical protein
MVGYYCKFVRHVGIIVKPLTELLKNNKVFHWNADRQATFKAIKDALVTAPVFLLPDFTKLFCIETCASEFGLGPVLLQDQHPIAFVSKALGPKMRGLSTYKKEYVAVLLAVEQWRYYLRLAEFYICTDQKSLSHLTEQRLHTSWQQKAFTKLLGFNYKIIYKKGIDNKVVDALSRRPDL